MATYLTCRAEAGATGSAIKMVRAAISAYHKDAEQADPTGDEDIKRIIANMAKGNWPTQTLTAASALENTTSSRAGTPDDSGCSPQLRLEPSSKRCESKRYDNSDFLKGLGPRQVPSYVTDLGEAWVGDSRKLLKQIEDESIDLVFTSPPYGLVKKKEYGNESQEDYVKWFRPFAKEIHRVLKPEGSFVLNIAGAWQKGRPTRALYPYRLVLDLCEPNPRRKTPPVFHLAQEFYWLNPAKIPNPVQWANVTRERVKDAVEPIWWLSKSPHPKASNRNVLVQYSEHMQRLLKTGKYNSGARPSGWNISKVWGRDNGGAIPSNFESDDALHFLFNVLVVSNTSSNDPLRNSVKRTGSSAHPAMFPSALPEFFVRMLTDEGDIVLDPFAGSNTTGWVADRLRRRWVSIDSESQYVENSRLRWAST